MAPDQSEYILTIQKRFDWLSFFIAYRFWEFNFGILSHLQFSNKIHATPLPSCRVFHFYLIYLLIEFRFPIGPANYVAFFPRIFLAFFYTKSWANMIKYCQIGLILWPKWLFKIQKIATIFLFDFWFRLSFNLGWYISYHINFFAGMSWPSWKNHGTQTAFDAQIAGASPSWWWWWLLWW